MSRKLLFYLVVGMGVMALGGVASAEAPVLGMNPPDAAIHSSAADPEWTVGQGESWQEREPVETGSMPASAGNSPELRCCSGDSGPTLDQAGDTVPRHGIDDGP
jgi:hypothetical protein